MSWVAVAVGVVGTATSLIVGGTQRRKAKKELAKLNAEKPIETLPEEIKQSQELANLRAKTGLPSEQYLLAQKNIARQQQRALRGAADRKMGLAMLPYLDDNANRALEKLDVNNANARRENERTLLDVNTQVGNWKKGLYDRNVRQVWNRNFDYNMGLLGQANENIMQGINSGINVAGGIAGKYAGGSGSSGLFGGYRRRGVIGGSGGDPNGGNLRLDDYGNLI